MIDHTKKLGVRYNGVNCDGLYGENPSFLRMLDDRGETFIADVHKRVYQEDPKPTVPPRKSGRSKAPSQLKARSLPLRSVAVIFASCWGTFCRNVTTEEVMRQMGVRHRKRQAAIDSAYKKQEN